MTGIDSVILGRLSQRHIRNLSNLDGAKTVEREIKSYWRARGYDVQTWIVGAASQSIDGKGVFGIRSGMLNGMPRE